MGSRACSRTVAEEGPVAGNRGRPAGCLAPLAGQSAVCVPACVCACVSVSACRSRTQRRVHEEGSVGGGPAPPRPALPFPGSEHLAQGSGRPSPLATRPGVRAAAALPPFGVAKAEGRVSEAPAHTQDREDGPASGRPLSLAAV